MLAAKRDEWRVDGCAVNDVICQSASQDGSYTRDFADAFSSHFHDYGYQHRELFNTTEVAKALTSSKWARHTVDKVRYDTMSVNLPLNWTRLYDGRIVAESRVFYSNGTAFDFVNGYGLQNRIDYDLPLERLIQEIKFQEEEKSLLD